MKSFLKRLISGGEEPCEDFYIKALRYADTNPRFTLEDLKKNLQLTEEEKEILNIQNAEQQFSLFVPIDGYASDRNKISHYISAEGKFKLLEYIELKEARKEASSARKYAIIALVISIVSILISMFLSYNMQDVNIVSMNASIIKDGIISSLINNT